MASASLLKEQRRMVAMAEDGSMTYDVSKVAWPVRTERLVIRPATADDLESTWQIRRDPEVSRWLTSAPTERASYAASFVDPDWLDKALVVELDGTLIGDLMLRIEDAWSQTEVVEQARGVQAELGWVIAPAHAGRGYATEAVGELIRICFEDLRLRRVVAHCFAGNQTSWRLMERLGMRREVHTVRESLHRSGVWLDGLSYALLADEWPSLRHHDDGQVS